MARFVVSGQVDGIYDRDRAMRRLFDYLDNSSACKFSYP